jgi:hypothetical protein
MKSFKEKLQNLSPLDCLLMSVLSMFLVYGCYQFAYMFTIFVLDTLGFLK